MPPSGTPRPIIVTSWCTASSFGRERAGPEVRAGQAALHRLAGRPVLPVGDVPELHGVAGSTAGRPAAGSQPGALDPGPVRRQRHHPVRHHVVRVRGDQQVRQQVQILDRGAGRRRAAASPPTRRSSTSSPSRRAGPSSRRPRRPAGRSCRRSRAASPGTAPGGSAGSGSTRGSSRRSPSSSRRPRRCAGRRATQRRRRRTARPARPGRRGAPRRTGTSGVAERVQRVPEHPARATPRPAARPGRTRRCRSPSTSRNPGAPLSDPPRS